jgi:predicted MPP superfamily phosphohydrolase
MRVSLLFFVVGVAAVSLGAHRIVLGWATRAFPWARRRERALRIATVAIAVVPPLARALTRALHNSVFDGVLAAATLELLFAVAAALPLLVLRLIALSLPRPRANEAPAMTPPPPEAPLSDPHADAHVGRRHALEAIGGAAVLGTTGVVLGWGATKGRHDYRVTDVPVRIPGLPRALDGYSIVQISDLHAGLFVGDRELREGGDRVRALRPDLLVVTGDLVDFDARHAPRLARALSDLAPRDGVYAILGNHDYYAGAAAVSQEIRAAGVQLLVNDGRVLRAGDGGGFSLLGLDDLAATRYGGVGPNLSRALAAVPRDLPRVLLSHQPGTFDEMVGHVALQLSGHTHGGQVTPFNFLLPYVAGRYERRGSTLYVNRGFGVSIAPERLGVPPEITRIILVAA